MKSHCQSQRIQYSTSTSPDMSFLSPVSLAALGATYSKALNVPPIVGGLAGAVIGGLATFTLENTSLVSNQQPQGFCLDCKCWFN